MCQSVCHTKQVERSTDRNPPPIFTKLAAKVETREICGYLLSFVEIQKTNIRQTGSEINFHHCSYKNSFNDKYVEKCDTYHDEVNRSQYETTLGLSIGTMTFDLE